MIEQEHQQVAELDTMGLHDPRRGVLLERLVALLGGDVRDEEDTLLPRLQARLSPTLRTTSRVLGEWAAAVERVDLLRRGERPETRTP